MNWKLLFGILISAISLMLAFNKVNPDELINAMETANYIYLIPAVLLTILSLWIRAIRWGYLLQPIKKININSLFSATAIGLMANNLLPARLGEFVRAYVIGKKELISKSASFATIVVERIFDGLTILLLFSIVTFFYVKSLPEWLRNSAYSASIIFLSASFFLILFKIKTKGMLRLTAFIIRPFSERIKQKVIKILSSFIEGLGILHSTRNIIIATILSLLVWLPIVVVIHYLFISFSMAIPIYGSLILLVMLGLGVMIPSAPGYIGTIQFVCVYGLAIFSIPKSQALSFSILYHITQFVPITCIGLIYLFIEKLSFKSIKFSERYF